MQRRKLIYYIHTRKEILIKRFLSPVNFFLSINIYVDTI